MEIDLPSPLGARASLPCKEKSEEKSGEKIEEVRSRPCVCDEGCAGNPGETVKALPGRPGRAGCGLPGAPMLPKAAAPAAPSSCRKEWPAFARLPSCRKSSARITAFPSRRPFAASHSRPRHAPRDTNHGLYGRSVRRWCERVAPPETAARSAVPADKSRLPCAHSRGNARQSCCPVTACLPGIARNCPELLGGVGGGCP